MGGSFFVRGNRMRSLTNRQARQFILLKHGLLGAHRFSGKQGAWEYIRQTGSIQFDPVDVCGKNAEIALQSRVKGFTKETLTELLYSDRSLFDYPDKCLCIIPTEDWRYFSRYRTAARENINNFPEIRALTESARAILAKNGPLSSDALERELSVSFPAADSDSPRWRSAIHWSAGSNRSRAVLEQMYTTGDLIIHHKQGARKFYGLAEKYLPAGLLSAQEPLPDEAAHIRWRIARRIGAVGLLWDRHSDAWLGIWGLKSDSRAAAFRQLSDEGEIFETSVEGIRSALYCRGEDAPLMEKVLDGIDAKPRCELLAPLDCLMWDRKLIKALFGFEYAWEIYTPAEKRKYGYYTLPLLYGEDLIGRVDAIAERKTKTLRVNNIWYENGVKRTKKLQNAVDKCIERFMTFNGCTERSFLCGI
jgi:uncharacterized protein YcaQ